MDGTSETSKQRSGYNSIPAPEPSSRNNLYPCILSVTGGKSPLECHETDLICERGVLLFLFFSIRLSDNVDRKAVTSNVKACFLFFFFQTVTRCEVIAVDLP